MHQPFLWSIRCSPVMPSLNILTSLLIQISRAHHTNVARTPFLRNNRSRHLSPPPSPRLSTHHLPFPTPNTHSLNALPPNTQHPSPPNPPLRSPRLHPPPRPPHHLPRELLHNPQSPYPKTLPLANHLLMVGEASRRHSAEGPRTFDSGVRSRLRRVFGRSPRRVFRTPRKLLEATARMVGAETRDERSGAGYSAFQQRRRTASDFRGVGGR